MYECDDKMVSHPSHYQAPNGLEAIDVIEAFTSDLSGIEAVDTANVIKYILRWKKKNGIQDLKKVIWYATHLVEHLEKEEMSSFVSFGKSVEKYLVRENGYDLKECSDEIRCN